MKLISLWEPWASLVAIGAKKIETRSWYTPYRGWVAIHSTKGGLSMEELAQVSCSEYFYPALKEFPPFAAQVEASTMKKGWIKSVFPHGCIVAVAKLTECRMVIETPYGAAEWCMVPPPEPELSFGNYELGRYGLMLDGVIRLPAPIPFKSRQGMLLDVPDGVVAQIQDQVRSRIPAVELKEGK